MHFICLIIFLLPILSSFSTYGECAQYVLSEQGRMRIATAEDIPDIATAVNTAFDLLADRKYLYQFCDQYPEEHAECARQNVREAMATDYMRTEVIEAPNDFDLSVIAVAIWSRKRAADHHFLAASSTRCTYRDLNMTRALDFDHKFTAAKTKHVGEYCGDKQLYLELLATHPNYQGRGAGTRLVRNGLFRAKQADINTTLIAVDTAETFYLHLGFTSSTNISIETIDGDKALRSDVMARSPH